MALGAITRLGWVYIDRRESLTREHPVVAVGVPVSTNEPEDVVLAAQLVIGDDEALENAAILGGIKEGTTVLQTAQWWLNPKVYLRFSLSQPQRATPKTLPKPCLFLSKANRWKCDNAGYRRPPECREWSPFLAAIMRREKIIAD